MPAKNKIEHRMQARNETEEEEMLAGNEIEEEKVPAKNEAEEEIENLNANLGNIKAREGVIGYILRDPKSASVDIKDPTKIIDYAILSSTALDSGEYMTKAFELGRVNNIIIAGGDVKVLSLKIGDRRLSVFMNKKVDHIAICKDLRLG